MKSSSSSDLLKFMLIPTKFRLSLYLGSAEEKLKVESRKLKICTEYVAEYKKGEV